MSAQRWLAVWYDSAKMPRAGGFAHTQANARAEANAQKRAYETEHPDNPLRSMVAVAVKEDGPHGGRS